VVKTQEILNLKLHVYLQLSLSYGSSDSGLISADVCRNARQNTNICGITGLTKYFTVKEVTS